MEHSESIIEIARALLKAQKVIGSATKGSSNPFFKSKYADLGEVIEVCKEPLNANGITVLQPTRRGFVETFLLHESGEWMSGETEIKCKDENNPQSYGSAITYAKRYGLQAMLFIPSEDDDGNSASKPKTELKPFTSDQITQLLFLRGQQEDQRKSYETKLAGKSFDEVQEVIDKLTK